MPDLAQEPLAVVSLPAKDKVITDLASSDAMADQSAGKQYPTFIVTGGVGRPHQPQSRRGTFAVVRPRIGRMYSEAIDRMSQLRGVSGGEPYGVAPLDGGGGS